MSNDIEQACPLCGEPATQDRIKYMLVNNKPLRN